MEIVFELRVAVPADTDPGTVQDALNAALDEGGGDLDWGDWEVGPALITGLAVRGGDHSCTIAKVVPPARKGQS